MDASKGPDVSDLAKGEVTPARLHEACCSLLAEQSALKSRATPELVLSLVTRGVSGGSARILAR